MPDLTPEFIIAQERMTAEEHEDLAAKAHRAGDVQRAEECLTVAAIARAQIDRLQREAA